MALFWDFSEMLERLNLARVRLDLGRGGFR